MRHMLTQDVCICDLVGPSVHAEAVFTHICSHKSVNKGLLSPEGHMWRELSILLSLQERREQQRQDADKDEERVE